MKLAAKFTPKPVGGLVRGASEFNCSTLNTNTTTEQIKIKKFKKKHDDEDDERIRVEIRKCGERSGE